jgi:hypothetical protein
VYEYAVSIIVALIAAGLPFMVFAVFLLLQSGAEYLSRRLQQLAVRAHSAIADNLSTQALAKSLVPGRVALVHSEEVSK